MGKSLPRTVLEATLAGRQSIEIKSVYGNDHVVPLAAVSPYGSDLVAYARWLRCKTCGTAPASVRLHRRLHNHGRSEASDWTYRRPRCARPMTPMLWDDIEQIRWSPHAAHLGGWNRRARAVSFA